MERVRGVGESNLVVVRLPLREPVHDRKVRPDRSPDGTHELCREGKWLAEFVVALVGALVASANHLNFAVASRAGWWVLTGCGLAVLVLGLVATSPWALRTAQRTAEAINPEFLEGQTR